MSRGGSLAILVGVCLVSGLGGFGLYRWYATQQPEFAPPITLHDLEGQPRTLAEWRGKLLLVNFWATWCTPCVHEIPMLVEAQQAYGARGLQIIGPALDRLDPVRAWQARLGINYPVMVGDTEVARAMDALGDKLQALPFSVLIDPHGQILLRHSGEFSREELQDLLERYLQG